MLPGMERVVARVNGIRLIYYRTGRGFPMVLLHGWPQTSYAWRKVVGPLARHFSLIVPDLRGLGGSDRLLAGYDMRTVSSDIRGLAQGLGLEKVILVGHDWGGIAGRRLALDSPALLERLVIVDVVPHEQVLSNIPAEAAFGGVWHFFFNAQPDLPEILVQGRVEAFLRFWFRSKVYTRASWGPRTSPSTWTPTRRRGPSRGIQLLSRHARREPGAGCAGCRAEDSCPHPGHIRHRWRRGRGVPRRRDVAAGM